MVKSYLRYVPSGLHGVITSVNCPTVVDATGKLLFTAQLENIGVWNLRKGLEVGTLSVTSTVSGDYSAKPEVTCLAVSPAGKHVAAGYADGMIRIFDYTKITMAIVLNGHRKAVTSLCFNDTGMLLASGSKDTDIIVWDLVAESGLCRLKGHKDEVTGVAMITANMESGKPLTLLVTSSKDTLVKVWDLSTLMCVQTIVGIRSELWGLAYMATHARVLVSASDNLLRSYSVNTPAYVKWREIAASGSGSVGDVEVLVALGAVVRQTHERGADIALSPSGDILAVQSVGKTVEIYKQRTPKEVNKRIVRRLKRHREKLKQREKRKESAAADVTEADNAEDDIIALAGLSLGDIDAEIARFEKALDAAAVSSADENRNFATAGDELELLGVIASDAKVTSTALFDQTAAGTIKAAVATNNNRVELFEFPLSDDAASSIGADTVKTPSGLDVFQAVSLRSIAQQGHRSDVRAVALSSDNALILTTSQGQAKIWNSKTGSCIRTLEFGDDGLGLCCAFGPANRHAIIGTKEGKLKLFDLASGDLVESVDAHEGPIWSIACRPDYRGLCSGSADKEAKFWDFELQAVGSSGTAKQLTLSHTRTLKLGDEILCVKYSHHKDPSKLLIVVSLLDSTVKVFFDDTLKFFLSMYGHKLPVMSMDISADDSLLVTASADKNVKLWGLDFGDCHKSFFAHSDSVTSVSFVANTHYFFCGSKDRTIKYYDGDRFEHILTLEGHKSEIWALAAATDGTFIVSAGHDRSIRIWRRSEEQVFLEEEREREMDALVEKDIRDVDGDALLDGVDTIGVLQADGTAKTISMDDPAATMPVSALGASDASAIVAHATKDSMKGSDRLAEALALAMTESERWQEYAEDVAAAAAAGEDPSKVAAPSRNPLLLNLTPARYILRTLRAIRPTDIDQVFLVLPFGDAMRLLRYLNHLLRCGEAVELCTKAALLILRVHQPQVMANQTLLPLIASLNDNMRSAVEAHKDRVGYNMAALKYLQGVLDEMTAGNALPETVKAPEPKAIRAGKRQKAVIF